MGELAPELNGIATSTSVQSLTRNQAVLLNSLTFLEVLDQFNLI